MVLRVQILPQLKSVGQYQINYKKLLAEFLKLNFKVEHGAFAMESSSEMTFIDTLELEKQAYEEQEALFEEAPENLVKAILAARGEGKA